MSTRSALWRAGLRFRKNWRALPGSPDVAFRGARLAVFLDGCFWHGCPDHCKPPKANAGLWAEKIRRNGERDARADAALRALGWEPLRVWGHDPDPVGCVTQRLADMGLGPRLGDG